MTNRYTLLLLAVAAAAAGAAAAMLSRGRHHRREEGHLEHKADIKAWENEGGGIAAPAAKRVVVM